MFGGWRACSSGKVKLEKGKGSYISHDLEAGIRVRL